MIFGDLFHLAFENLWRTKLRSVLTTLGVVIGVGMLVSMISFGSGVQRNVTESFKANDLFTSMEVVRKGAEQGAALSGAMQGSGDDEPVIDDAALDSIRALPGVEIAYPEIRFPATVRFGGKEAHTTIQGVPLALSRYRPFDELPYGRFFAGENERAAVINERLLSELGVRLADEEAAGKWRQPAPEGTIVIPADSILGRDIEIVVPVLDGARLAQGVLTGRLDAAFREEVTRLTVVGIRTEQGGFEMGSFASGVAVPAATALAIPHFEFSSVWQALDAARGTTGYPALNVRVRTSDDLGPTRDAVEAMGYDVVALADQLAEFKRSFLIIDALLGAIGIVALVIAGLGIVNTMVTSILERTREIGLMKAVGGSEGDIMRIFFVEAGAIGAAGGVFGVALGWAVTRLGNVVVNHYLRPEGFPPEDLFDMPPWLIGGAIAFSIVVTLIAGLYPALRAARVDPVTALRHE
jgi:ABC-type lipoprotein release transport system permease subunit